MFDFDLMALTYLLILGANLALILLVGNLAAERVRDAWTGVAGRAQAARTQIEHLRENADSADARVAQVAAKVEEAQRKLKGVQDELAAVMRQQQNEPLPFVYCATLTEIFDSGGAAWEFLVQHDEAGNTELDPHHPARQWLNGRLYQVQAASPMAARRQLERYLPKGEGFRITATQRQGVAQLAEAG